jgi:hypothetical protein
MNYASVITVGVIVFAYVWYFTAAHKHYTGPRSNLNDNSATTIAKDVQSKDEKFVPYKTDDSL